MILLDFKDIKDYVDDAKSLFGEFYNFIVELINMIPQPFRGIILTFSVIFILIIVIKIIRG